MDDSSRIYAASHVSWVDVGVEDAELVDDVFPNRNRRPSLPAYCAHHSCSNPGKHAPTVINPMHILRTRAAMHLSGNGPMGNESEE